MVVITRRIEFDAGHRIPDHKSKCRNIHGHRYVLECTLHGDVIDNPGASDHGMIRDFGDLKALMMEVIGEPWDHAFLCYRDDEIMRSALQAFPETHKTVLLPFAPTVEQLCNYAHSLLSAKLNTDTRTYVYRTRLYETPNCWADCYNWRHSQ